MADSSKGADAGTSGRDRVAGEEGKAIVGGVAKTVIQSAGAWAKTGAFEINLSRMAGGIAWAFLIGLPDDCGGCTLDQVQPGAGQPDVQEPDAGQPDADAGQPDADAGQPDADVPFGPPLPPEMVPFGPPLPPDMVPFGPPLPPGFQLPFAIPADVVPSAGDEGEPDDSEPDDSEPDDSEPDDSEPDDSEPDDSEPDDSDGDQGDQGDQGDGDMPAVADGGTSGDFGMPAVADGGEGIPAVADYGGGEGGFGGGDDAGELAAGMREMAKARAEYMLKQRLQADKDDASGPAPRQ